jgi:hypothetical protein
MGDYTNSKSGPGVVYPDNAVQSAWNRTEPLVTPEQVRARHLFGIPLVSGMTDPVTGKKQVYTDELLKDTIDRAIALVESDVGIDIFPVRVKEKLPFDKQEYASFGFMKVERRPVASVEALTITPPSGQSLYSVPLEWIETANLAKGQINLIPIGTHVAYGTPAQVGSGGALFLHVLGEQQWVPAFWQVEYTSGYPDGLLPKNLNELVGVVAAMEVLSLLAATYAKSTSHSLGIDGLSQSVGSPGPQIFAQRLQELAEKRKTISKKLKTSLGLSLFSGNV